MVCPEGYDDPMRQWVCPEGYDKPMRQLAMFLTNLNELAQAATSISR